MLRIRSVMLGLGLIAVGLCFYHFFALPHLPPPPESWPIDRTGGDAIASAKQEAQEYSVWSAVLSQKYARRKYDVLLIDTPTILPRGGRRGPLEPWVGREIKVAPDTWQAYLAQLGTPRELQERFALSTAYRIIRADEIDSSLFRDAKGWTDFYEAYPGATGIIRLSRVALNRTGEEALVYVEIRCGGLCGGGEFLVLERGADGWKIKRELLTWVS